MKRRLASSFALMLGLLLGFEHSAHAASADAGADAAADASRDDGEADAAAPSVPLACGGALCDTSTGSTCALSHRSANVRSPAALLFAISLLIIRRRRERPRRHP